jgi:CDP-6-deoxy-D-xylo-4-hexulose-3-dehydrase
VGGNLLRQPYLKDYSISGKSKNLNADIIHENGIYIGNSQFVNFKNISFLEQIMGEINETI